MHRFDVASPAEAVRALVANFPTFERYMIESGDRQLGFKVINGGEEIESVERIGDPASGEIKIVPVVVGSGGAVKVIIGAVLIAAAIFLGPAGAYVGSTGAGLISAGVASATFAIGVSLTLSGVAQMISPPPKLDEPSERPGNKPSYVFNGPVNTTAQGQPVPVGYGRLIVGGAVISASIVTDRLSKGVKRVKAVAYKYGWKTDASVDEYYDAAVSTTSVRPPDNTFATDATGNTYLQLPDGIIWREYRFSYYVWTVVPA